MTNSRQLVAGLRGSSNHEPERESVCMRACVFLFLFYAHVAVYTVRAIRAINVSILLDLALTFTLVNSCEEKRSGSGCH